MKMQLNDDGENASIIVFAPFFDGGSAKEALTLSEMVADVVVKRTKLWSRRYEITGGVMRL